MLRGFFGNLIFAIIARMLGGNHLNSFLYFSLVPEKKATNFTFFFFSVASYNDSVYKFGHLTIC